MCYVRSKTETVDLNPLFSKHNFELRELANSLDSRRSHTDVVPNRLLFYGNFRFLLLLLRETSYIHGNVSREIRFQAPEG